MNAAVEQALALCSVCMGVKLPPPSVKETHRPAALYKGLRAPALFREAQIYQ